MNNLKIAVYGDGGKLSCPHCNSIQIKAMRNQPKKYPEPKMYWHSNTKEVEALKKIWDNGYDCKKCGNEFIALKTEIKKLWEQEVPIQPKKSSGFLKKLLGWILLLVIAFIVYAAFISPSMDSKSTTKNEEKSQVVDNTPENISIPETIEDPLKQEFSKEAEEAAHAYIPPETKESISDSQNKDDTLSIKTTLREKDE